MTDALIIFLALIMLFACVCVLFLFGWWLWQYVFVIEPYTDPEPPGTTAFLLAPLTGRAWLASYTA